jgi:hypothetical protein
VPLKVPLLLASTPEDEDEPSPQLLIPPLNASLAAPAQVSVAVTVRPTCAGLGVAETVQLGAVTTIWAG